MKNSILKFFTKAIIFSLAVLYYSNPLYSQNQSIKGTEQNAIDTSNTPGRELTSLKSYHSDFLNGEETTTQGTGVQAFVLGFPLAGQDPYNADLYCIFDHDMTSTYSENGTIVAYTGEKGEKRYGSTLNGYAQNNQKDKFLLTGSYGACGLGTEYLFYDGHSGTDFRALYPTKIYAAADGVVIKAYDDLPNGTGSGYGNEIRIEHIDGYVTLYAHLAFKSAQVRVNDQVKRGDFIAEVDNTGDSGGDHLHFEVFKNGRSVDPYGWQGIGDDPYRLATNVFLWDTYTDQYQWVFDTSIQMWKTRDARNYGINSELDAWVIDPGTDPAIISPRLTSINAQTYQIAKIRMSISQSTEADFTFGEVLFIPEGETVFSVKRSALFDVFPIRDGQEHTYRARMASNNAWQGNIQLIQINPIPDGDPASLSDKIFINYIEFADDNTFALKSDSPVDLVLSNPNGRKINKTITQISGSEYLEADIEGDNDIEDYITIENPDYGTYKVEVIPEAQARPTDSFSLILIAQGDTIRLVDHTPIQNIPSNPFVFNYPHQSSIAFNTEETSTDWKLKAKNYPNPFNQSTSIEFELPKDEHVEVTIFNFLGQEICTLLNEYKLAGTHKISWNGTDLNGQPLSSGVYFVLFKTDDFVNSLKIVLVR